MHVYDALIIGCGYASVGYATAKKNVIICEERQICDNNFYLPLSSFTYEPYVPKTDAGVKLKGVFDELGLFDGVTQNVNGFECAFCKYIVENPVEVLLKCRVLSYQKNADGIYDVNVYTNQGITHIFAKEVLNSVLLPKQKVITVLFTTDDIKNDKSALLSAFNESEVEPAFYSGRYALRVKVDELDENSAKTFIYEKWQKLNVKAKIIYIAPIFLGEENQNPLNDANYKNPIKAFESGYFLAMEKL